MYLHVSSYLFSTRFSFQFVSNTECFYFFKCLLGIYSMIRIQSWERWSSLKHDVVFIPSPPSKFTDLFRQQAQRFLLLWLMMLAWSSFKKRFKLDVQSCWYLVINKQGHLYPLHTELCNINPLCRTPPSPLASRCQAYEFSIQIPFWPMSLFQWSLTQAQRRRLIVLPSCVG